MRAKKIYENIRFERGLDPKKSMGIGMEKRLKPFSLENAEIHFSMPIDHILKKLKYPGSRIYLLGQISEYSKSSAADSLSNLLGRENTDPDFFINNQEDQIINTEIGPILIEKVGEEEGYYYWAPYETAVNFELWKYEHDWAEWF